MTPPPDADSVSWLRMIMAFAVVGGLLAGLGLVLRYLSTHRFRWVPAVIGKPQRLQLVETLPLDARRRLVIVRCDDAEHLLLLGLNQDRVVAHDLARHPSAPDGP